MSRGPKLQPVAFIPATEGFTIAWANRAGEIFHEPLIGWAIFGDGEPHAIGTSGRADNHARWAVVAPKWAIAEGVSEVVEEVGGSDDGPEARTEAEVLLRWAQRAKAEAL